MARRKSVRSTGDQSAVKNSDAAADLHAEAEKLKVETHRCCPICWNRRKGIGEHVRTVGNVSYYKCPECTHNWSVRLTNDNFQVEWTEYVKITEE